MKDFLLNRERTSIFAATTAADMRYMLLLILQTCVLGAVCTFNYLIDVRPELGERIPPYILLGVYLAIALLYLFWKWVTYSFLGWIFLTETVQASGWSLILHCFITLDLPFPVCFIPCLLRFEFTCNCDNWFISDVFTKILMFYKWIKLFVTIYMAFCF